MPTAGRRRSVKFKDAAYEKAHDFLQNYNAVECEHMMFVGDPGRVFGALTVPERHAHLPDPC